MLSIALLVTFTVLATAVDPAAIKSAASALDQLKLLSDDDFKFECAPLRRCKARKADDVEKLL